MKNNILASIALFGVYRKKNLDTYDLVAQYILATIAQKEYTTFTASTMKDDLKELYFIEIPTGVIKSVAKNRIEGVTLSNGSFYCPRIPKDDIEKEYRELNIDYNSLFKVLLDFVKSKLEGHNYSDDEIKNRFADFLPGRLQCAHVFSGQLLALIQPVNPVDGQRLQEHIRRQQGKALRQ